MNSNKKIWFVTGASKGLGLSLVKELLKNGYRVAATTRDKETLIKGLETFDSQKLLPLKVDLKNEKDIAQAIDNAIEHFGGLDVLVNNAGYGIGGTVEELSTEEIQNSFDINVFAVIKTMQAAMLHFRKQRSGHIINISSIAGFAATTGWGMYAAQKSAVTGLSEVMAGDVAEFGVHVTVVAPGAFRTAFLKDESLILSGYKIEEYKAVRDSHKKYATFNEKQIGNPEKYAEVLVALAENPNPPVHLFVGSDAYDRAKKKIDILTETLEENKSISFSTDYEDK